MAISLKVNGTIRSVDAEPDTPLLYVLRNDLELNGAKFGCGMTQCGACTVLVDGTADASCVTPVGSSAETRSPRSKGSARSTSRTRCRRPSSMNRRRNAAIASTA